MTVTSAAPSALRTLVYPSTPAPQFPEQSDDRYSASTHPVAVCFSGGGPRSFSASIGQMRGLQALPLYKQIGAISVVSGGSWFGALFTFANPAIPDDQLLGTSTPPGNITLRSIGSVPHSSIGFGLTQANNARIFDSIAGSILRGVPSNRLYARILNSVYCSPFDIDDVNRFFTLDTASMNAIIANNPGLTANDFYLVRNNRPYLVAGATQVYPTDRDLVMRHWEYSPLYDGTEQLFPVGSLPNQYQFGGGFLQNFAMESSAPQKPDAGGLISVSAPLHRFTVSDMMGSSGAAPGSVLDKLGLPSLFAEFHYWPPQNAGATPDPTVQKLSIVDGGDLENTGIVAMLRRQYPVIICCVNTSTPMNPDWKTNPKKGTYEGIDTQISALFGYTPATTQASQEIRERAVEMVAGPAPVAMMQMAAELQTPPAMRFSVPQQPIQVFPQSEWSQVQQGLMAALAGGGPVWTASQHTIQAGNPFGIQPYPGDGKVTVIWLYNQKIAKWVSQLQPEVQNFLGNTNKRNYMVNFPNYETVFQNKDAFGIPELLLLTPQQVSLIGDMWSWAIAEIADDIQQVIDRVRK